MVGERSKRALSRSWHCHLKLSQPQQAVLLARHSNSAARPGRALSSSCSFFPRQALRSLFLLPHFPFCRSPRRRASSLSVISYSYLKKGEKERPLHPPDSLALFEAAQQSISDIADPRKRIARDTLFRALHYSHLPSCYKLVTSADGENNRSDCESAEATLLKQCPTGTYDLGWWRRVSLLALTLASSSPTPPFTLLSGPVPLPPHQAPDNSEKELLIFCHDAGPAAYNGFISLNPDSRTTRVETTVLAFARLDAWSFSVVDFLLKKSPRRPTSEQLLQHFPKVCLLKHHPTRESRPSFCRALAPFRVWN